MEQQILSGSICDGLPPLSANYPWLVAQILEGEDDDTGDHMIFYTVSDPLSHYRCRISELLGRRIRACLHGWVILSNPDGDEWSLWNPVTSKLMRLPRLILKDEDSDDFVHCCLSSPPDDPGSILLLTRHTKPNIVFCRLDRKRKRLRWTEMSYARQLKSITGNQDGLLRPPICCNGKVYACVFSKNGEGYVIQVHIVVKEKQVLIRLLPFVRLPGCEYRWPHGTNHSFTFLKASRRQLFTIVLGFPDSAMNKPVNVFLYKLDMSSMVWVEMEDLKGIAFFLDMASVVCSPAAIVSESGGGYIHILHEMGKVIYSYHVKDKTISLMSCMHLPPRSGDLRTSHISVWPMPPEFRLQGGGDHGDELAKWEVEDDQGKGDEMVATTEAVDLLNNIPFHVLEMMMEFCVGVEYLNFRATCKRCLLAAPMIQWSNGKARRRLQTYSSISPWLMVFDKDGGIISFTDPMFGDKYFIKAASPKLFFDSRILCSRYGWLLLFIDYIRVAFFNPFTGDIRELPPVPHLCSFCFSAPPTSPDCMVVGFSAFNVWHVHIHFVAREPASWHRFCLDLSGVDSPSFGYPTFCGPDVYTMFNEGRVDVFREIGDDVNFSWEPTVEAAPRSGCRGPVEYFQVKCDEHDVLVVMVGEFGESVEVWKLKEEEEWEKVDDLGRHMIYICGATCVCMDAKTPEMENKIYFPRLHSGNGKIVFYSMETHGYHTFDGRKVGENFKDFCGTKHHVSAHAWIEPSSCQLPVDSTGFCTRWGCWMAFCMRECREQLRLLKGFGLHSPQVAVKDLEQVTCSLEDIQLRSRGTILLVGHSLNNDLQALKVDHTRVIDTFLVFKYWSGSNFRRLSLNDLCKSVLGYELGRKVLLMIVWRMHMRQ